MDAQTHTLSLTHQSLDFLSPPCHLFLPTRLYFNFALIICTKLFSTSLLFKKILLPHFLHFLFLSLCVCSAPLCGTMSLSLPSLPPLFFLGYQTIFPAMRLVTPPPFGPLPPPPPFASCGRAPIREMITLRHSVIWQRRAAAAHTELPPSPQNLSCFPSVTLFLFFLSVPPFSRLSGRTRDLDVCQIVAAFSITPL